MAEITVDQKSGYSPTEKTRIYKRRIHRAIERVVVDKEEEAKEYGEIFKDLLSRGNTKYERIVAAFEIVHRLVPQAAVEKLRERYSYRRDEIPVSPKDYTLMDKIGYGGVNDVFFLRSNKEGGLSYVLKVNLGDGKGRDVENLVDLASEQKKEYEQIVEQFKGIPGLVPEEHHVVIHGPSFGKPAAAMIQPFIGDNIRDIFQDFKKEELQEVLKSNKYLTNQLTKFTKIVKDDSSLIEKELDILGERNLAVVGEEGTEKLLMMDPHFRSKPHRSDKTRGQIEEKLNYLQDIVETLK